MFFLEIFMKTWHSPLLASAIIALSACGGSSSSSNNSNDAAPLNPDNNGTTYGRVIDGYLEDAFVCIDSNNDNQCSTTENPIQTDDQGRFNLTGLSNKSLIAQAITGVTKDSDDNGVTIKQGFTLTASSEHGGIITPFTTLLMAFEKSELSKADALEKLSSSLDIPTVNILQNYVETNNSAMAKIAQILVDTIQYISVQALQESENPGEDQLKIEALAWSQLTPEALVKLTELRQQNSDALPNELITLWMTATPELNITKEEVSGSDPVDPDPVDPNPTDPDPVDPDPTPSDQFSKISAAGLELAADATDYACVIQNIDADGQAIPSVDRNTWMLLIPADATYADIGFTPTGYAETDLFWSYEHPIPDGNTIDFTEANGVTSQYSNDNQLEALVTVLNENKYCGFSDWTIPSISQLQELNTKPLISTPTKKTIDRSIFKSLAAFETQTLNRLDRYGDPIDPARYPDRVQPYFWTSTRTIDNSGNEEDGIYDFQAYLHATETNSDDKIQDAYNSSYYALRAVRNNRFQRVANDGNGVDLTTTEWTCVKDNSSSSRHYWSNPIKELSDVTFDTIEEKITAFNNVKSCGFSDWRLPTKQEIISLKTIMSNTYFNIGEPRSYSSYSWSSEDYVWIAPVEDDAENVMYSWQLSDSGLTHGKYSSIENANLFLIRDDAFSAIAFDLGIDMHSDQIIAVDTLQNNFDAIAINTSASTEDEIKETFNKLSTLPELIEVRGQSISTAELALTLLTTQYSALYVDVKTTIRADNLILAQAEQLRIKNALIEDANTLKTQLDDLFSQYNALSNANGFSSDTARAEVLNQGIGAASSILSLLTSLGDILGANNENTKLAIQAIIVARELEAESLPSITLNDGYIKIAKNGDIAKTSANYGDDWRCVKQVQVVDDFTTTTFLTLLNEPTDLAIQRDAMSARLETINSESLCGISNWVFPELDQLKSLNTLDILTENSETTKTIDPDIFINHKEILNEAPLYWYKESSGYVLRYATTTSREDDEVYVSSWSNNDFANARFIKQSISYQKVDMSCGDDALMYQGNCYQAHNQELIWEDAKQSCINNGKSLIEKDSLTDKDFLKLAIGLNLSSGSEYWLTKTLDQYSYPNYLKENSSNVWKENTYGTKTNEKKFICKGPATALTQPASPTSPTQDDDADTFGWTNTTGFPNVTDYQFSLDNGISWKTATSNPIYVENLDIDLGFVQVRIKAVEAQNAAGELLKSTQTFNRVEGQCSGGDAAGEVNNECYQRYDAGKTWTEARDFCIANGTSLVVESTAISNAIELASALDLATSSTNYWLLDNELNYGRARTLTNYSGWRAYDKQATLSLPFICVK
jgi:hypothetical protein